MPMQLTYSHVSFEHIPQQSDRRGPQRPDGRPRLDLIDSCCDVELNVFLLWRDIHQPAPCIVVLIASDRGNVAVGHSCPGDGVWAGQERQHESSEEVRRTEEILLECIATCSVFCLQQFRVSESAVAG